MPSPIRIILADEDPNYSALVEAALRPHFPDLFVQATSTEAAFLSALEGGLFSLVVAECNLSWASGTALLARIRAKDPSIPVLFITAAANEKVAIEALGAGLDGYVLKTAGYDLRLCAAVRTVLQRMDFQTQAQRTERHLGNLLTRLHVGVFRSTGDGRLIEANPAFLAMLGFSSLAEAQSWGMDNVYLLREERSRLLEKMREHGSVREVEVQLRRQDGRVIWVQMTKSLGSSVNGEMTFEGLIEDITDRKRFDQTLKESEERFALAATGTCDGLWDWNLANGEVSYSPRFKTMFGLEGDGLSPTLDGWLNLVVPEDVPLLKGAMEGYLEGSLPSLDVEYRVRHQDRHILWMKCEGNAVRGQDGRPIRLSGIQRNITERKESEELLKHDTLYDGLTGLPNRSMFMDRLQGAVDKAQLGEGYAFALFVLNLDRFQFVNDSLGHVVGDQLIIALAHRLKSRLRPGDTLARLGGDEFAMLVQDVKVPSDAERIAERIHQDLERPFELCGHEIFASTSVGIAFSAVGSTSPEVMLRDADTALHRAKAKGRARHEVFHASMHTHAVERLKLEGDMRRALDRREFKIHFQPIVSLETWKIAGFEALLRWQHPDRGLVLPEEFIPLAEDTGLIIPIAKWVLLEACRQTSAWQAMFPSNPPISVSVNLSSKNLAQPDLIGEVDRALADSGLSGASLGLEITESALIQNTEQAVSVLASLRALNIQLHIDDFGTGYSSLSYLQQFPIDALKIDKSFTARLPQDGQNAEIVRTIMSLAKNLGLSVIAEGVETREQAESLRELDCKLAQGFFFHRPLDTEQVTSLLRAKTRVHLV